MCVCAVLEQTDFCLGWIKLDINLSKNIEGIEKSNLVAKSLASED